MQSNTTVFEEIGEILTLAGVARKDGRRVSESDLSIVKDAALVCVDGKIKWLGPRAELDRANPGLSKERVVRLGGRTVLPGFVECHTHMVFAGSRAEEFEWRMQGQSYQEISAKGGGILSTVKATRTATETELAQLAQTRADRFTKQGVTMLEVKSGYGLDLETELKMLRVARQVKGPKVVSTYLGAHSRSPEFVDLKTYMTFMVDQVLPRIAKEKLADRVDIYIEKGFYDLELGRHYFEAAQSLGLPIVAHVEQLSAFGGTRLALEFKPLSVDHIVYVDDQVIGSLAKSDTTAVLLPISDLYLKMDYPPARKLIDAGARVALSTDFNPGTSPSQDLSLLGLLARVEMGMSLAEVISGLTFGAAAALSQAHQVGSLEVGKSCDFSVIDGSWRDLFYRVGEHPVEQVYRSGQRLL